MGILDQLWQRTVELARAMAPELLHERAEGEWSFIETLRHLLFAMTSGEARNLGEPVAVGSAGPAARGDARGIQRPTRPRRTAVAGRGPRAARGPRGPVRQVLADLTDAKLTGTTEPVTEPGYPEPESSRYARCLQAILNEGWEHRLYAERDFDVLESR